MIIKKFVSLVGRMKKKFVSLVRRKAECFLDQKWLNINPKEVTFSTVTHTAASLADVAENALQLRLYSREKLIHLNCRIV